MRQLAASQPLPSEVVTVLDEGADTGEALFALARDKSAAGRLDLFEAVRDAFLIQGTRLSERERTHIGEILRHLVRDMEMTVRKHLSEQLASRADAPPALVRELANDEIEIARPVLVESEVLQDPDLIEIIRHRAMEHQLVVSMRKNLSEAVSQALVSTRNDDVITSLLRNHGAEISREVMEYLVSESERVSPFQKPLVRRSDLPVDLAERMYTWVSKELKAYIQTNFQVDPRSLERSLAAASRASLADGRKEAATPSPPEALVERAEDLGESHVSLLVASLRDGEVPMFEAAFGKMSGLPLVALRRIVYAPGGDSLALLCKAVEIDLKTFLEIFELTRGAADVREDFDPAQNQKLRRHYVDTSDEDARRILGRWRRTSHFAQQM